MKLLSSQDELGVPPFSLALCGRALKGHHIPLLRPQPRVVDTHLRADHLPILLRTHLGTATHRVHGAIMLLELARGKEVLGLHLRERRGTTSNG